MSGDPKVLLTSYQVLVFAASEDEASEMRKALAEQYGDALVHVERVRLIDDGEEVRATTERV